MKTFTAATSITLALALSVSAHGPHQHPGPADGPPAPPAPEGRGPGPADPRSECCAALAREKILKDKVWTPSEQRYDDRLAGYYSANAALAPWCMVVPETTIEVSKVMNIIDRHDCPFGMRAGGHAAFTGSNSIENGVTIDLGYMNGTTYDQKKGIASIQPGSTWGAAFTALAPHGVVAVGGRATPVGVGGFTTGGGYSFHTGLRGFACDNIKEFEVVLGDGKIVKANEKHHQDLWKALKGGSGNFGIVTSFEAEVFPSADIWASLNVYTADKTPQILQSYYDFVNRWHLEPESQLVLAKSFMAGNWVFGAIASNVEGKQSAAFDPFFKIEALQSIPAKGPAAQVVPIFSESTPAGLFANWQTGTFAHTIEMLTAMDELAVEYVDRMREAVGDDAFEVIFQSQPVTQSVVDVMKSRGGNVLGLEAVVADGPVNMYNIVLTVKTAADQDKILPIAFELNKALGDKADELGANRHWVFPNYAHGSQDPLSHYGAENIEFMRKVSEEYDHKKVFQNLRQTGFHLPQ